jgi:ceramide glucosyltransferase
MYFEMFLTLAGAGLLLQVLLTHGHLLRALRLGRRPQQLESYPSVTVIRPIKGLDAGAEQNIRAAIRTGYPGEVETLFVFDDDSEPALPVVERVLRQASEAGWQVNARVLFSGHPPKGRTGKLNAMIVGLREAKGELVAFADSDVRPDMLALTTLVETLMQAPDAGSAFAPVVVSEPPRTVGDAGYALLLNGLYGAAAAAATKKHDGGLPFIMGQFMVFKRGALEAIGGLECADGQLVDDMYLGSQVTTVGLRNVVSPRQVPIIQEGLSFSDFLATYRRWITFSRTGLPGLSFKLTPMLHGIVFWVGLLASVAAAVTGNWLGAIAMGLAPVAVASSINSLHEAIGGARLSFKHRLAPLLLILVSPVVYLSILTHKQVNWRGRTYSLDVSSKLAHRAAQSGLESPLFPR